MSFNSDPWQGTRQPARNGKVAVERERRVEVLVRPRKGQAFLKWTKNENLSIQKEATIQVHFSITIITKITRASSPISVHQSRAVDHLAPTCSTFLTAWHETCMKLIAWLAREAIWLPTERSIKQHLPIHQPQILLLPFWYQDSLPVSLHHRFPQTAISHAHHFPDSYGMLPSAIMTSLKRLTSWLNWMCKFDFFYIK